MKMLISALVLVTSSIVAGQRGSFAGTRPIGFPDTPNRTTTTPDPLANRFGDGLPERLPIEANGDWDLVDRLSKLPIDKQPFWFINWQAYEKQRKDPQTYPQRPNPFVDPIPGQNNANSGQVNNANSGQVNSANSGQVNNANSGQVNSANSGQVNNGFPTPTTGFLGTESTVIFNRFSANTTPSQPGNNVSPNGNFNNNAYPISNMYPSSNVYPNINGNSNVYPSGNSNPTFNVYNDNNPYTNVYPTGNPISNVYPTGNPNSNEYQTSNLNAHSNSGAVTKNGASFQTTQKYQRDSLSPLMSSNVGTTNLNKYPEYYAQTDTYPQISGHDLFF